MPKLSFTTATLRAIKTPARSSTGAVRQDLYIDATMPGFGLVVSSAGARSWVLVTRLPGAKNSRRIPIGRAPTRPDEPGTLSLAAARTKAEDWKARIRNGEDPSQDEKIQKPDTEREQRELFENVVAEYIKRSVIGKKNNRTADETQRIFDRYVLPSWRGRRINSITRSDVHALLDKVYDRAVLPEPKAGKKRSRRVTKLGGPVQADRVLSQVRALMNWHATRDDKFMSPIVRGMARTSPKDRARRRVLSDNELRIMWPLLDSHGVFGAIVKTLLLTAQRRDEVSGMRRSEIDDQNVWTIPAERYKGKRENVVPLSPMVADLIDSRPTVGNEGLVFTTNGKNAFANHGHEKARLHTAMLDAMREEAAQRGEDVTKVEIPNWTPHDLRRTAKTLMSRAGVRPEISERVLGHVISGVEGTYDRYSYLNEKRDALERLASLIQQITQPNVQSLIRLRA